MKRITIHFTEAQVNTIGKLAEKEGVAAAEITRRALDFGLLMLDMEGPLADIEFVRQEMERKDGAPVSYQQVFHRLAFEKAIEYRAGTNNSARIQWMTDEFGKLREVILRYHADDVILRQGGAK